MWPWCMVCCRSAPWTPASTPSRHHQAVRAAQAAACGRAQHIVLLGLRQREPAWAWPLLRDCLRHAADPMSQRNHAARSSRCESDMPPLRRRRSHAPVRPDPRGGGADSFGHDAVPSAMVSESAGRIWHQEPTGCGSDLHLSDHDDHQIGLALLRRGTSARPRRHRLKSEAAAFGASSSSAESGKELARPCARSGGIAGSGGGGVRGMPGAVDREKR